MELPASNGKVQKFRNIFDTREHNPRRTLTFLRYRLNNNNFNRTYNAPSSSVL